MASIETRAREHLTEGAMIASYRASREALWPRPAPRLIQRPAAVPLVFISDDEYAPWLAALMPAVPLLRPALRPILPGYNCASKVRHAVAGFYGITITALTGKCRCKELILPRHVAMYLLVRGAGYSSPRAGQCLCRDHTTVLHAVRKIELRMKADLAFAADVAGLIQSCGL